MLTFLGGFSTDSSGLSLASSQCQQPDQQSTKLEQSSCVCECAALEIKRKPQRLTGSQPTASARGGS
eukprot:954796-Rhodomonas_salina.2